MLTQVIDVNLGERIEQNLHSPRRPVTISPREPVHVERELVRGRLVRVEHATRERLVGSVELVIEVHLSNGLSKNSHAAGRTAAVRPCELIHDEGDPVSYAIPRLRGPPKFQRSWRENRSGRR